MSGLSQTIKRPAPKCISFYPFGILFIRLYLGSVKLRMPGGLYWEEI